MQRLSLGSDPARQRALAREHSQMRRYRRPGAASAGPAPARRASGLRKTAAAARGAQLRAGRYASRRRLVRARARKSVRTNSAVCADLRAAGTCPGLRPVPMVRRIEIAGPVVAGLAAGLADRVARRSRRPARAAGRSLRCKSWYSICRTVSDRSGRVALASLPRRRSAALKPGACGAPLRGCGA